MGDRVRGSVPGARNLSQYIMSHPGQLSLAIPPWVGIMTTSQRAVMPYGWVVKAGMVCEWVAGRTVIPLLSRVISERFSYEFIP